MRLRGLAAKALGAGPRTVDLLIALLVQAAMTMPFVVPRAPGLPEATWTSYGLTTLMVLPLIARRRAPVAVLLAVLVAGGLYRFTVDGPGQPLPYTGLVAFYTVAELSSPPKRTGIAALTMLAVLVSVGLDSDALRELLFSLFVFAAAYAFGRLAVTRKAYLRAVEDRARQLELTHLIEAEQAAARERARIAREMHDVLSHAVSLMIVQAEAGPVAVRTAPERAEAAFDAISESGRDAMVQLRRMLGVLREGDGEPEAPREPQPVLDGLPGLVERVRAGGPPVSYEVSGNGRPPGLAVEATVYRIVQEALTNVVRHAGAASVRVRLEHGRDALTLTVTDDGRGPGGGAGLGLTGIRERAAAHGGTARTGPGPDGRGFRVAVTIPHPRQESVTVRRTGVGQ
ncbi:sensor histidine kinase [Streptomyces sp. P01-B04]|uniref:sensor histidine kinase n=1 Tax=Streptomyces poriferorum TaxID=2798799 RepID=UPI001C5CF70C|nr:histidine kinase [Streptomyces poriferorum]MBW5248983.1 sensor histidine kinase [Streptomyces poriferorum]MBW5257050.1 sensor histidine kinase [Streptomyces poriferorum]